MIKLNFPYRSKNDLKLYTNSSHLNFPYRSRNDFKLDAPKFKYDWKNSFQSANEGEFIEPPKNRSMVNRVFSALNVFNYAGAGFARGIANPEFTPMEGFVQGLRAGNPFGQGHEEWKHSYSDYFTDAGWEPDGIGGKIAKFAIGTAADIFLDPMTYISGGLMGAIKGSGKASVEVATKGSKYLIHADDVGKGLGLSIDTATDIVKSSGVFKSGMVDDLVVEASELARKYNKLIGVNSKSAEVTFSLGNAPFGKKIFGAMADKKATIFTSEQVMSFGDKTIAPGFAKLRDGFIGSKIGKLFSPSHGIYKASKNNPLEVYNHFKHIDMKTSLNASSALKIKEIEKIGKQYLNLSPAENREVIKLMEDPSKWSKVESMVQFSETKKGAEYIDLLKKANTESKIKLEKLTKVFDGADDVFDNLDLAKSDLSYAKKVLAEDLLNINKNYISDVKSYEKYTETISNATDEFTKFKKEPEEVLKVFEEYSKGIKQRDLDTESMKKLKDLFGDDLSFHSIDKGGRDYSPLLKSDIKPKDLDDLIPKPVDVNLRRHKKTLDSLMEDGYVKYKSVSKRHVDKFLADYSGIDFQVHTDAVGDFIITKKGVTKNFDVLDKIPGFADDIYSSRAKIDKVKVVDDISEYVFGQKGMINVDTYDFKLEKITDMMKEGKAREEIGEAILLDKDFYTGKATKVYDFAAKEIKSYGSGTDFKTWNDYYTKRIEPLNVKKSAGEALTNSEEALYSKLKADNLKRELIKDSFSGMTNKEVDATITKIQDDKLRGVMDEFLESTYAKQSGEARDKWMQHLNGGNYSLNTDEKHEVLLNIENILSPVKETSTKKTPITNKYLSALNTQQDELSSFLSESRKFDGKLSQIGEIKIGKDKLLRDSTFKEISNVIKDVGEEAFKQNSGIETKDFNRLKRYLNDMNGLDIKAKVEAITSNKKLVKQAPGEVIQGWSNAKLKKFNEYADEVSDILNDKYKDTYSNISKMSEEQTESIIKRAIKNVNDSAKSSGEEAHKKLFKEPTINNNISKIQTGIEEVTKKKEKFITSLDDVSSVDELYNKFYSSGADFLRGMDDELYDITADFIVKDYTKPRVKTPPKPKSLSEAKRARAEGIMEARNKYKDNHNKIMEFTERLTEEKDKLFKNNKSKVADIEKLSKEISKYEEIISSNSAFETYMRSSEGIGNEEVSSIMDKVNKNVGKYILDPEADYSETIRKISTDLKNELIDMGAKEVEIGRLGKGQFENLMEQYLPHMITPEAKKIIEANRGVIDKEIKGIQNFGAEYGFGRKFNPNAISRNITELVIDGKVVKNPSIVQINDYFEPLLKGNKMFNETVGELFIARATQHTKLMYDNEFMEGMVNILGKDFTGVVEDGYSSVMNYGKLKQFSSDYAQKMSSLDKSDMISDYLADEATQSSISQRIIALTSEVEYSKMSPEEISDTVYQEFVDGFIKRELTPDVTKAIFDKNLGNLMDASDTRKALEELQLPFTNVSAPQYEVMGRMTKELQERATLNIKKSFKSLTNSDGGDLKLDEMKKFLEDTLATQDVSGTKIPRFESLIDKIDRFGDIKTAQVGQMQTSIISKTNQARQLQIIRDNSDLLNMYDKATHFMKLNQTTVLPSFHTKNKFGNTFRSWLDAGEDILNPEMQMGSFKAIKSAGEYSEEAFKVGEKSYKWSELFDEAQRLGVMDDNLFAKEVGASASDSGLLKKILPGKYDPTNTADFLWYKTGTKIGSFTENQDRLLHFASRIKNGMGVHEAAEMSQKFLFDYSDLTFFEQNVMKRVIPYYTWLRKNTPLQVEMLLTHPDKFRNVSKVLGGVEAMVPMEDRMDKRWVNDFARDWIQTPFSVTNPDGRKESVMLNPNMPYSSFNDIPNPFDLGGTIRNYANMTNPLIKVPAEQIANKHTYFDSPIVNKQDSKVRQAMDRVNHIGSQFSVYPVAKGYAQKRGADLSIHNFNTFSGTKALSYDYETFKAMKYNQLSSKRKKVNSVNRRLGEF